MSERARRWLARAAVGAVIGVALGFAVGWWLWPVEYTNTAPTVLRQDYRDDYVVMVAAAYEVEGDLAKARERLERVDPERPAAPVVELAERLVEANGGDEEIVRLARLAWALGSTTPVLAPYLEGPP